MGQEGGRRDITGDESGGLSLFEDVARACPNLKLAIGKAKPDVRVLLMADRKMTMFHARESKGECDDLKLNNTLVFCRNQAGFEGCVWYAALSAGKAYDLSIDLKGAKPSSACGTVGK